MKNRVLSGMRPTGRLHLGHLMGALENWVKLQENNECFFMVADWHALMSEYEAPSVISESVLDNVADWLAAGVDPAKSTIFIQSQVAEHAELYMILSCLVPLGWLERCPTYKEQLREQGERDLRTYGFLGYPVLQAADILLYKASRVPVGEDQLPHLELTREIARRFNGLYKRKIFPDPQALLTASPRLLGLDKRKMSKSYGNTVNLSDDAETIRKKIQNMVTDPRRIRRTDPGHPQECNVHSYYAVFLPDKVKEIGELCKSAQIGCTDCKRNLAEALVERLDAHRKKREPFLKDKERLINILRQGRCRASGVAGQTIGEIKKAIGFVYG